MKYNAFISYAHAADGQLTPIIQDALHRLGKPWYKRRALNIFRDYTNLPATPHLWPTIVKALEQSEYFILMASLESAGSRWVFPEVEYWLTHRSIDTLLIVHTGGTLSWDDAKADFDPEKTDALHPVLFGKFAHEPFIVDLTKVKTSEDLSLSNPEFKDPMIRLAATLHKLPQNDFIGEEIKQHKKTIRIRNGAIMVLFFLLVSTGAFLWRSIINGNTAKRNLAKALFTLAETNIDRDPTLSFRLAEAAYKSNPGNTDIPIRLLDASNHYLYDVIPGKFLGMSADHSKTVSLDTKTSWLYVTDHITRETIRFKLDLSATSARGFEVFEKDFTVFYRAHFSPDLTRLCLADFLKAEIVRVFDLQNKAEITLEGDTRGNHIGFSASGDKLFISDWQNAELPLRVWDLNTGKPIRLKGNMEHYNDATFTSHGQYLLAGSRDGIVPLKIWNLATGDSLHIPGSAILDPETKSYYSYFTVSYDGKRFAMLRNKGNKNEMFVYEINRSVRPLLKFPVRTSKDIRFTDDGAKLIVFDFPEDEDSIHPYRGFKVFDLSTRQEIISESNQFYDEIQIASNGKRLLAYTIYDSTATKPVSLWDLESGNKLILEGEVKGYSNITFSSAGKKLIGINEAGDLPVKIWDAVSGTLLFSLSYPYSNANAFFSDEDQKVLLYSQNSTVIKVIDLKTRTEFELLGNIGAESVVFTPGANAVILTNSSTGLIRIWDISEKIGIADFIDENNYYSAEFSENGALVFLFGINKEGKEVISVGDLEQAKAIEVPEAAVEADLLSLSSDAKKLLIYNSSDDRTSFILWNITSGKTVSLPTPEDFSFSHLFFGDFVDKAIGYEEVSRRMKVYDLNTLDTIPLKNASGYYYFDFSDAGDKLLAYDNNGEIPPVVWGLKKRKKLELPGTIRNFRSAKFSPDDTKVIAYYDSIAGNRATGITLWDLVKGDLISLEHNDFNFNFVEFSPDGYWLLAYDTLGEEIIRLWNIATGRHVKIGDNVKGMFDIYFSKDGSKLMARNYLNNILLVWDLTLSNPEIVLKIDDFNYSFFYFTPDGRKIIGVPQAGNGIKVWNIATGETVESDKISEDISKEYFISDNYLMFEYEDGIRNIFNLTNGNISELQSLRGSQFLDTYCVPEENRMTVVSNSGHIINLVTDPDSIIKEVNSRKGKVWQLDEVTRDKYGLSAKNE